MPLGQGRRGIWNDRLTETEIPVNRAFLGVTETEPVPDLIKSEITGTEPEPIVSKLGITETQPKIFPKGWKF